MIRNIETFRAHNIQPPFLERREVIIPAGVSARQGLGKRLLAVAHAWQEVEMPWAVPVPGDKMDRSKVRKWLNAHCTGIWAFCLVENDVGVRFSNQTEASAFRIWWC